MTSNEISLPKEVMDAKQWNDNTVIPEENLTIIIKRQDGSYRVGYYGPEMQQELMCDTTVWAYN